MTDFDEDDSILLRLDAGVARELLAEFDQQQVRIAPSLRGVDLAAAGSVVLVAAGHAADLLTLVLAREHLTAFAKRLTGALLGRTTQTRLTVNLTSASGRLTVELSSANQLDLAAALHKLADLADAAGTSASETSAPGSPTSAAEIPEPLG